jgi:hypothetical protein
MCLASGGAILWMTRSKVNLKLLLVYWKARGKYTLRLHTVDVSDRGGVFQGPLSRRTE